MCSAWRMCIWLTWLSCYVCICFCMAQQNLTAEVEIELKREDTAIDCFNKFKRRRSCGRPQNKWIFSLTHVKLFIFVESGRSYLNIVYQIQTFISYREYTSVVVVLIL